MARPSRAARAPRSKPSKEDLREELVDFMPADEGPGTLGLMTQIKHLMQRQPALDYGAAYGHACQRWPDLAARSLPSFDHLGSSNCLRNFFVGFRRPRPEMGPIPAVLSSAMSAPLHRIAR